VRVSPPRDHDPIPFFFGEDQGRYVLSVPAENAKSITAHAKTAGVAATLLGSTGGDRIEIDVSGAAGVAALRRAHEGWFPAYMGAEELPPIN
jgi:phosphoribosylformylglycinamidine synthase